MLIRLGYDIVFETPAALAMVAMLYVHPSRQGDLREPDELSTSAGVEKDDSNDSFGNRCARLVAPAGMLRLQGSTLVEDSGEPDPACDDAVEHSVAELPTHTLQFLLSSRYCEVDLLSTVAFELFGATEPGWPRVQAILYWVHNKITFGYPFARPTKTALEVFTDRRGVCRAFQHLALTFCRCMNIPARYATGYLGDIGVPVVGVMDFSAWFEVYLGDRWWTVDARHNQPRIGRVLMATGRDASDVALTTAFGAAHLKQFTVVSEVVQPA